MSRNDAGIREAVERIETVRRQREGTFYLPDERITLSHGSGGKATRNLVEGLFARELSNPLLDPLGDSAILSLDGVGARLAFTTDSFVVHPLIFAGGDIGELAVNGTVNDLAVAGAEPLHLSLAVILEEGFALDELRRIVTSVRKAAEAAGVDVVTGDTKVVEKGKADGAYLNTAGVGRMREGLDLGPDTIRPGDRILLSGPIAEHGVAILMAREELALESDIESDTAPLVGPIDALLDAVGPSVRCMRDATRGGVAAVLNEVATAAHLGVEVEERSVPIRDDVRGACEILGIDPFHIANEGKLVAVVAPEAADEALEALRGHPLAEEAAVVGRVVDEHPEMVVVRTGLGGRRVLDMLVGDALPRIC